MAEEHNQLKYGSPLSIAGSVIAGGGYGDVGISRLSESLVPILNLWERPEFAILRSERNFSRRLTSGAVAARFSTCEVVNPAGSKMLAVIDLLQMTTNAAYSIDSGAAIAANPVVNRGICDDSRWPNLGETSLCTLTTGDTAAGIVLPQGVSFNNTVLIPMRTILSPGFKLFIVGPAVNTQLDLMIRFHEKTPFPGELQARG